jgi:hypothetical protein
MVQVVDVVAAKVGEGNKIADSSNTVEERMNPRIKFPFFSFPGIKFSLAEFSLCFFYMRFSYFLSDSVFSILRCQLDSCTYKSFPKRGGGKVGSRIGCYRGS